jgi:hypothetical protein
MRLVAQSRAIAITVAASVAVLVAAFLPWLRSGHRARSSFELIGAARGLGLVQGWELRTLTAMWYFIPLLVAVTWTAGALRRDRLVVVAGALVGTCAVAAGTLAVSFIGAEIGPIVSIGAGTVAVTASIVLVRAKDPIDV